MSTSNLRQKTLWGSSLRCGTTWHDVFVQYRRRFPLLSPFGVQRAHAQGPRFGWFWRFLHDHQPPPCLSWASLPSFMLFGSSAVRYIVALTGFPLPSPKYANFTQFAIDLNEARLISKMVHWKAPSKGFPTQSSVDHRIKEMTSHSTCFFLHNVHEPRT